MRRKYTTEERRVWNRRYYEKRKKSGWVNRSFHVPKSVGVVLDKLKCDLMAHYEKDHAVKWKIGGQKAGKQGKKLIIYAFKRTDI